jgi:hypothetical protein
MIDTIVKSLVPVLCGMIFGSALAKKDRYIATLSAIAWAAMIVDIILEA